MTILISNNLNNPNDEPDFYRKLHLPIWAYGDKVSYYIINTTLLRPSIS